MANLKEIKSLKRLKIKCKELNLNFKRLNSNNLPIDCFINNYNIQCKSSSTKRTENSYVFLFQKNAGKINGNRKFQPYSDKDNIDFFILEILDYPNNFYIIPIKELIRKNIIKTDINPGRLKCNFPIPLSQKDHWSKKYLNNFDQLKVNPLYDLLNKLNTYRT